MSSSTFVIGRTFGNWCCGGTVLRALHDNNSPLLCIHGDCCDEDRIGTQMGMKIPCVALIKGRTLLPAITEVQIVQF